MTVSASANFAALVFKQVLDPLPLAAQLHFKVIVHCHGRRGRGAGVAAPRRGGGGPPGGSGSRGPREAARSTPGGRSAGSAAAAGARGGPARAPGTSSGAAGRGPAGVGWGDTRRGTRGRRRARDEGWGWGARSLPLSPRAPGLWLLRSGRALGPRGGRRRRRRSGLSLGRSRLAAVTHAHARSLTRSLPRSLSRPLRQKGSAAQQPAPPQRAEGGDSQNAAALSQKRREDPGHSAFPAARAARRSNRASLPRGAREPSAVGAAQSSRQQHHVGRPGGSRGSRLQHPECTGRLGGRPAFGSAPREVGRWERCTMGFVVQKEESPFDDHLGNFFYFNSVVAKVRFGPET